MHMHTCTIACTPCDQGCDKISGSRKMYMGNHSFVQKYAMGWCKYMVEVDMHTGTDACKPSE